MKTTYIDKIQDNNKIIKRVQDQIDEETPTGKKKQNKPHVIQNTPRKEYTTTEQTKTNLEER